MNRNSLSCDESLGYFRSLQAWLDLCFLSNPRVPIAWASVETLIARYFSDGPTAVHEQEIEVAILSSTIEGGSFGVKGTWRRTSPDEVVMAIFQHISNRMDRGADDEELTAWLHFMLTCPAAFVKLPSEDDISWGSSRLRENIETNNTLSRTAVQKVFEIAQRRTELNNVSASDLWEIWNKKWGKHKAPEFPRSSRFPSSRKPT